MYENSISIRQASIADADFLPVIERSAALLFAETEKVCGDRFDEVLDVATQRRLIVTGLCLVAVCGRGQVVGFVSASVSGTHCYIYELSVRRAFQRRGIGRELMEKLAAEARRRAIVSLWLKTDAELPWNAPFYTSLDYKMASVSAVPPRVIEQAKSDPRHTPCENDRVWMFKALLYLDAQKPQ